MKQQPRKNVSKGKRRKENKNKSERLVKIALIAAVLVFAFVIYKIFDILVLSNEKYDLSGETYYQYFYGIMEEYSGKMDVVQRNDDIQLVLENGKVIYLDSTPIYYKNVLGKMLFAKPMELVIPDVGNYKLSKFTNIYEENNTMQIKKFNSSKSKTINNGFIFDGNDLYFFLDDTVITIGDTEYELPPLSYVIVNYRTNVEIYNYDKNEYTIIQDENALKNDIIAVNKAKNYSVNSNIKMDNLKKCGYIHCGFKSKVGAYIQPRVNMAISLINENNEQLTETELLNNFKRNAKRYHGDFQTKRGVSFICVHDNSYLDDFYRIIKSTEARQGISLRNKDYFKRIMDAFGSDANMYIARVNVDKFSEFLCCEINKSKDEALITKYKNFFFILFGLKIVNIFFSLYKFVFLIFKFIF